MVGVGQESLAINYFRSALKASPGFVSGHFNLGVALAHQGQQAEAENELRQALALDPEQAAAHVELGLLLASKAGTLSEGARKELTEGLCMNPHLRVRIPEKTLLDLEKSPPD